MDWCDLYATFLVGLHCFVTLWTHARSMRSGTQVKNGATIMGGGYTMLGWLHGVTLPGLTHARVGSADYACWRDVETGVGLGCSHSTTAGDNLVNYWNFAVAPPSLLSWALGMLPDKDTWFTNATMRGSSGCMDPGCLFSGWCDFICFRGCLIWNYRVVLRPRLTRGR